MDNRIKDQIYMVTSKREDHGNTSVDRQIEKRI